MPPPDPSSPSDQILLRIFQCATLCNCCLIMALGAVVIILFGQVELLSAQVSRDQEAVERLQIQVQEKQQGQIQQLNEAVQEEHNLTVTVLAGTFTLLTCLISMFHMTSHLQRYNAPIIQRKIVAILWMSPIYSVTSFASLVWPAATGWLAIIKDCFEAYCIYTFLAFLIAVLGRGDRDAAVEVVAKHASHLPNPTRWLRNWYHPPPESSDLAKANAVLTECQILAIQFVLIRPLTSIAGFMFEELDKEEERSSSSHHASVVDTSTQWTNGTQYDSSFNSTGTAYNGTADDGTDKGEISQATVAYFTSPGFFISMITNLSVFFAFTGLLKFYHAVHTDLEWCKPWPKFLTIKGVVFLTFWQGLVISIVVHFNHPSHRGDGAFEMEEDDPIDPSERAAQLQNILVCLEMLLFSITHWCVFPADEWDQDKTKRRTFAAKPGIGLRDLVSDVNQLYHQSRNRSRTLSKNSRRDVMDDSIAEGSRRRKGGLYGYHGGDPQKDSSSSYEDDDDIYGLNRPGSGNNEDGILDETVIVFPEDSTAKLNSSDSQDSLKIV